MALKQTVRGVLRRVGIEIGRYELAVPGRRLKLLKHLGLDLVADVGANDGRYAEELRSGGFQGRLVSFEPASGPYSTLAAKALGDPLWDVKQVAVGASSGRVTLNVSRNDLFSSILPISEAAVAADAQAGYVATEEVPVEKLDALIPDRDAKLGVKIDVQGFERQVFDGAQQTLARACFVEVEVSPTPIYDGQMMLIETIERLSNLGLTLALTENVFPEYDADGAMTGRAMSFNGIFIRPWSSYEMNPANRE